MGHRILLTTALALSVATGAMVASTAFAAPHGGMAMEPQRGGMHPGGGDMQRGPRGYMPPERPGGIENRPAYDRDFFNHNFQSNQGRRIGPYHGPDGWQYRRWGYGEILPREFWGEDYWLSDYWLFGLEVPPPGYEWVRYGPDALLVNIATGEIIQTVYDDFL